MKRFTTRLWAVLMLMLVSLQTMATDVFTSNRTDFRDESIYFMITTRFYDGDTGNNVLCWDNQSEQIKTKDPCWRGDFQGVIDKLDYIKALGFTAIWITPVVQNASGYDYHGYHAMDFQHVDCRYQSSNGKSGDVMFQELIDKAHAKGIKIILDIVLNHTGNFGEEHFCKEFDRDTRLRNQADINACMIPNLETLGSDYPGLQPGYQYKRRLAMMKNTDGNNHDIHNYWHHTANNWNWDDPSRWMGQIAGDCVDLNTENDYVADYLVKCYGQFIKMGVDGFRIDTSGHISRLTFNKEFIPQFAALGKQYEDKRLNKAPFFMYGEVCTRMNDVTYRGQQNLSCYFYTWKSDKKLLNAWNGSKSYWDSQVLPEGAEPVGPQQLCLKETTSPKSENAKMINSAWHEPDYSQASGFNVIDFPMHYSYNTAQQAFSMASGDECYNDATYNVVYVDSHDYSPGPNDTNRFGGTDAQWAENLSLLFTFRGIPCLYYGSEVGFRRGKVIDKGPNGPLSNTGRAYFGGYITGDVEASDFGEYKASGNVAASLNHDLAQHLIRLNKIRQAVPALRKGQWTDDGCTPAKGGIAFKRAYKDSYALVALNGGATFTDCPAGTYTDLVTGKTYTGPTITVDAPNNQGQVRVLVKDWKGGKLIDDGAFIYETAAQHKGDQTYDGNEEAGTTWVDEAPLQPVSVSLSPAGGTFRTNTVTVTATLSEDALSGWYQIEGQNKVDLTPGEATTFTIGEGMNFKDTKTVTWSATSSEGNEKTGKVTYTKVDPNAAITVYVKADKAPTIYAWVPGTPKKELTGAWHGQTMDGPEEIGGVNYWYKTFDGVESFNVVLNNGNDKQSSDITGITGDIYLEYDGGSSVKTLDAPVNTTAKVTLSPNGGDFQKTISVTATLSNNAKSGWYKIGDGEQVALTPGKATTFPLGDDMLEGESKTVTWSATNADNETKTGSATFNKIKEVVIPTPTGIFAYFLAPSDWSQVDCWAWNNTDNFTGGNWPGVACTKIGVKKNGLDVWMWKYDGDLTTAPTMIIFNNGGGPQTKDLEFENGAVYNLAGKTNESVSTGINQTVAAQKAGAVKIYTLSGVKVAEVSNVQDAEYILAPGMYICNGKKFVIK